MKKPTHLLMACLILWGCHDARRVNPLDPDLTPAVTNVAVVADDEEGVVFVEWSAYVGTMRFAHYVVMRREQGRVAEDTVAVIGDITITVAADTSAAPETDYEYRVITVNDAGYGASTAAFAVRSFRVNPVEIEQLAPDPSLGVVTISWTAYEGSGFEGYEILRRTFGGQALRLTQLTQVSQEAWIDTSAQPQTNYTYWMRTHVLGESLESATKEVSYTLAAPTLSVAASSACACVDLEWSPYDGPRFVRYDVYRSAAGQLDTVVSQITDATVTHIADSLLQGNTQYTYRIGVITQWEDVVVESERRSGIFHELVEDSPMTSISDTEVQALAIAIDDSDQRWMLSTLISTTTARIMRDGVRLHPPDRPARTLTDARLGRPDRISPVRSLFANDQLYGVVRNVSDSMVVFSVDQAGDLVWVTPVAPGTPVDLYVDENIQDFGSVLVLLDETAEGYLLDPATGELLSPFDDLARSLSGGLALPIQDNLFASAFIPITSGRLDAWFLLAPQRTGNMSLGQLRSGVHIGSQSGSFDDGIGLAPGQLLNPLVLDLDRQRQRLVVVESRGILQVLDASDSAVKKRRGLTRWGTFGQGPGQFFTTPTTAVGVAVDGQGRIHVADAATIGGRVQIFSP